jgi:hypothetical protein
LVAPNGDVDILEIVLARAADRNRAGIAGLFSGSFVHGTAEGAPIRGRAWVGT